MNNKIEGVRLYERISRDLSTKIANGELKVDHRLPSERDLARSYGVSRATIREAIIALELDGLVKVRTGSGVYVAARAPPAGQPSASDIGPFELLEARRAIEGEVCALAAARITDEALEELERLVAEMKAENGRDIVMSEDADRRFHLAIAGAAQNSGLEMSVRLLWDARARSPQYQSLSLKAEAAGLRPRIDEHAVILDALRSRSPEAARHAMHKHLTQVIESLLEATEFQELENARAKVEAQRKRLVGTL